MPFNEKDITAVLFDLDDTLFNSTFMSLTARRNGIRAMIEAGLNVDEEEAFRKLLVIVKKYGSNYGKHFNRLLEELGGESKPKLIAAAIVAYHSTKQALLRPFPGVITTLLTLMKKMVKIGIVSDGVTIKQWEKLTYLGLQHFFDAVVINEKKDEWKPAAKGYLEAMKKLDLKSSNKIIFVGNKVETDILGAKRVGMTTILFDPQENWNKTKLRKEQRPDFIIRNFREILELFNFTKE